MYLLLVCDVFTIGLLFIYSWFVMYLLLVCYVFTIGLLCIYYWFVMYLLLVCCLFTLRLLCIYYWFVMYFCWFVSLTVQCEDWLYFVNTLYVIHTNCFTISPNMT